MTVAVAAAPARRRYPAGWWGMVVLIMTEASIFAALIAAYVFLRASSGVWPEGGIDPPELTKVLPFTFVLLASSAPLFWGEHAIRRGRVAQLRAALAVSFVLGLAFITNQALEYRDLTFGIKDNAYASLFYVITGLHGLHVVVGLVMNAVVQVKAAVGRVTAERHLTVSVFSLYWHFVDAVWIVVFSTVYVSPHIR